MDGIKIGLIVALFLSITLPIFYRGYSMKEKSEWSELQAHQARLSKLKIIDLFDDKERLQKYSLEFDSVFLDYSKNFIDDSSFESLLKLAKTAYLKEAIAHLFSGEIVNPTENRPALHTALRQKIPSTVVVNKKPIATLIQSQREKMYRFVQKLNQGEWLGVTEKPITDVVNLGIGGSDLGPLMTVRALKPYQISSLKLHFVSNIDPEVIDAVLKNLNPETTLFVISSKSFTTPETLTNAMVAKAWLQERLSSHNLSQHFIAITANAEKAKAFGVNPEHILDFWDWVGGRYSIWSTIGFPLALTIGEAQFEAFLAGANSMDQHFASAPFEKNMPVILALLGIWYNNFWNAHSVAVLPYLEALNSFPDYLQQLDMESNGKSIQKNGQSVSYATGPIIWGQAGTKGQHAFYQLLHQGTHLIPIDFILFSKSRTKHTEQHIQLVANGLAQSAALMQGRAATSLAHENMPGNKPSNTLLFKTLTPYALGQLIALYEHKVFVQGIIWQINSFDQPGVELGKKMASNLAQSLQQTEHQHWDASTQQLIEKVKSV